MQSSRIWHLVARKLSKEATMDELRELEKILEDDPALAYNIETYSRYFEQPLLFTRSEDSKRHSWEQCRNLLAKEFPESFAVARNELPVKKRHYATIFKWTAIAACLLLIFSLAFYWHKKPVVKELAKQPKLYEMSTMPGTRSKMELPDGTTVWLNSDSRISYNADFGRTKREVTLSGEAYFDVARNEDVPMVVHARTVNIWVKGTAFNVRNYPESATVETSLIRGSVELTTNADPGRKILLKPNEKITIETKPEIKAADISKTKLAPLRNKHSYYHIDILHQSSISNTIPEVSWVENKLVFDNDLFADVIIKMQKWYNIEIILNNNTLAAKQFSGVFHKENIFEALSALQIINHFEFEIKGQKVFIK